MKNNERKNKISNKTNRKFKTTDDSDQKKSVNHYDKQQELTAPPVINQSLMVLSPFLTEPPTAHNINIAGSAGALKTYQKFPKNERGIIHIKSFDVLSPIEIYNILKIRQDTFVIEQKIIYDDIDGKDVHCIHVWCQDQRTNEFLAYLRIVPLKEVKKISIGRVLTIQTVRKQGIARELMRKGIQFAHSCYPDYLLTLSAKEELCSFYETLGFKKTGKPFFYPKEDPTPIFPMVYVEHKNKVLSFSTKLKKKKWA